MNMKLCEEERELSCCYGDTEGLRSVVTFRGEQGKTCVCLPFFNILWMPVKNMCTEKN